MQPDAGDSAAPAAQTLEASQPLTATVRQSVLSGLDLSHDPFYHPLQHGASLLSSMQQSGSRSWQQSGLGYSADLPHASQLIFPGEGPVCAW